MQFQNICQKVLDIIDSFPKSYNGLPYLTLGDGRKCYFDVFIRKYGLTGTMTKYTHNDIVRRVRLVEFFDSFLKVSYLHTRIQGKNEVIDSSFYRMVLGKKYNTKGYRIVLISFYHYN